MRSNFRLDWDLNSGASQKKLSALLSATELDLPTRMLPVEIRAATPAGWPRTGRESTSCSFASNRTSSSSTSTSCQSRASRSVLSGSVSALDWSSSDWRKFIPAVMPRHLLFPSPARRRRRPLRNNPTSGWSIACFGFESRTFWWYSSSTGCQEYKTNGTLTYHNLKKNSISITFLKEKIKKEL